MQKIKNVIIVFAELYFVDVLIYMSCDNHSFCFVFYSLDWRFLQELCSSKNLRYMLTRGLNEACQFFRKISMLRGQLQRNCGGGSKEKCSYLQFS